MAASFKIEIAVPVAVRHLHADSCSQQNGRSGDFFESISAIFLDNKHPVHKKVAGTGGNRFAMVVQDETSM